MTLDRRHFLKISSAGLMTSALAPNMAFANAPTDKRFVIVFLRGGLDGLHALVPYEDRQYLAFRQRIAVRNPLKLDGYFGLNPELKGLHQLYQSGDLTFIPAASTDYRERSHFDAQNFLENGSGKPYGASDGWLNRALTVMGAGSGQTRLGLSVGHQVPLIMQGSQPVQTWSESRLQEVSDDFLSSLSKVYASDPLFAKALRDANSNMEPDLSPQMGRSRAFGRASPERAAEAAAQLLAMPSGPRIAVIESQGWDTHHSQNGRLNKLLAQLDQTVMTLKTGLAPVWSNTVIMVVSEFGRTVAENANGGTDHGTGGLVFMAGGGVKGGQISGQWPGLSGRALHDGRDLKPVNSIEAIFKSVLISHLGIPDVQIYDNIFPGNRSVPMDNLLKI